MGKDDSGMTRLHELLNDSRGQGPRPEVNSVGGLIDLIGEARPRSVLEIGSDRGISTEVFLLLTERVVALDPWPDSNRFEEFWMRCGRYKHLEIVTEESPKALRRFRDGEFDLVYIDALHDYRSVSADIEAAKRVARHWIAGHDHHYLHVRWAVNDHLGTAKVFSDSSWLVKC